MSRPRSAIHLALAILVAACSPAASGTSATTVTPATPSPSPVATTPNPSLAATATTPPAPLAFVSTRYGYTLTLPAGWTATEALVSWDSHSMPGDEENSIDLFEAPTGLASMWGFAGPVTLDLAGFTKERIEANARDHGDTCPPLPDITEPVTIGGQAGTFLAWDCGILINLAITVDAGVGYVFVLRDAGVHAATDPNDRAIFDATLGSVVLPD